MLRCIIKEESDTSSNISSSQALHLHEKLARVLKEKMKQWHFDISAMDFYFIFIFISFFSPQSAKR